MPLGAIEMEYAQAIEATSASVVSAALRNSSHGPSRDDPSSSSHASSHPSSPSLVFPCIHSTSLLPPLLLLLLLLLVPASLPLPAAASASVAAAEYSIAGVGVASAAVAAHFSTGRQTTATEDAAADEDDDAGDDGAAAGGATASSRSLTELQAGSAAPYLPSLPSLSSYQNSLLMDDSYKLYWTVDAATSRIHVAVRARTKGYIGLGISEIGAMVGSGKQCGYQAASCSSIFFLA